MGADWCAILNTDHNYDPTARPNHSQVKAGLSAEGLYFVQELGQHGKLPSPRSFKMTSFMCIVFVTFQFLALLLRYLFILSLPLLFIPSASLYKISEFFLLSFSPSLLILFPN